jgi:hypothetical protein
LAKCCDLSTTAAECAAFGRDDNFEVARRKAARS